MTRLKDHDAYRILREQAQRGHNPPFSREWLQKYERQRRRERIAKWACIGLLASVLPLLFVLLTN